MHAIIQTGPHQHQITTGDQIQIQHQPNTKKGDTITLDQILLIRDPKTNKTHIGKPTIPNATITAQILNHTKAPKTTTFKMKRRKGYHLTKGHRQKHTTIQIKTIHHN